MSLHRMRLSQIKKQIFLDFSVKNIFDHKLIQETKQKLQLFYMILKDSTIPLL